MFVTRKDERRANRKARKVDMEYGARWRVVIVLSASRRVFGESAGAHTPRTARIEIATKTAAYNRNPDMDGEIIREVRGGRGRPHHGGTRRAAA